METIEGEELRFALPDGLLLAAKGWGDESATVNIIAIHGFLDSAASFDRLAPLLVAKSKGNIRIVAVDLSGHGKSAHRPDYSNYLSGWITEVVTVADAMGWDQFSLMSHSMGTAVAVILAGALPHRLRHLILFDAIGPNGLQPEQVPVRFEKALQQRLRLISRQPRTYATMDSLLDRMLQSDAQLTRASAKLLVDRCAERVTGGLRFSHDPKLKGNPVSLYLTEPEAIAFIKRISCPTLLIWASHRWYPLDQKVIETRQAAFQNIVIKNVEGNHHVHLEHPERVVDHVLEHLLASTSKL